MTRKGDWMQTYTGGEFWPFDPRPEEVRLDDIAAALSKLCRYGGHTIRFYSVAEHCVLMAEVAYSLFDSWMAFQTLNHDDSEAYLVDMPRPIKMNLPQYKEVERGIEKVIAERFGLDWPMPAEVKALDEAIIADEKAQVMAPSPRAYSHWKPVPPLGVTLKFWTPKQAQYEFIRAFHLYGGKP